MRWCAGILSLSHKTARVATSQRPFQIKLKVRSTEQKTIGGLEIETNAPPPSAYAHPELEDMFGMFVWFYCLLYVSLMVLVCAVRILGGGGT